MLTYLISSPPPKTRAGTKKKASLCLRTPSFAVAHNNCIFKLHVEVNSDAAVETQGITVEMSTFAHVDVFEIANVSCIEFFMERLIIVQIKTEHMALCFFTGFEVRVGVRPVQNNGSAKQYTSVFLCGYRHIFSNNIALKTPKVR